jgi:di/tricarboxylate transporter
MKNTNLIVVVVLALVAFMFMKNSQSARTTTTSKTVGVTPATSGAIQSVINGLVSIFGKSESAYSGGDIDY